MIPTATSGRVRAVHRATRRGLAVSAGFVVAAVVSVFVPNATGWWLPLHLFLVGGLLSAMSAVTQMLAVTWSSSPAPPAPLAAAQRWGLAVGTAALVAGREWGHTRLTELGGVAVLVAVIAMVPLLWGIRRDAITHRFRPAIDAYVLAFVAGAAGSGVALVVATGRAGNRWGELRDVHVTLNLLGLVGLVIAGTLPYFAATQLRAKMPARATPTRIRAITLTLALTTAVAGVARTLDAPTVIAGALAVYAISVVAQFALLPTITRKRWAWAGPRVAQLGSGVAWWAAMTLLLAAAALTGRDDRAVLVALVIGGYAQILIAALAYLGPVLRGGGHRQLTAGFAATRSWPSLAAGNVAALAALVDLRSVLAGALAVWSADVAYRALRLVTGVRVVRT